ncbi:MAG TPA: tetratricopeptide repeat protein [Terriglobales bacterium]|nr:tetratricopeptide repeat protein [Terriglobales bacterium]
MLAFRNHPGPLGCLALTAVFLTFFSAVLSAQEVEGNITGEIRLVDGSFPRQQIQVSLDVHGSIADVKYCDSEGRFSFNHLLPNAYVVVINTEGYLPFREDVIVNPTVMGTNYVHVVLRADPNTSAPDGPRRLTGANSDTVSVVDLEAKYPPQVKAEFDAGQKAEAKGDTTAAIEHYRAALKLAPDFYQAHNNLGGLYIKKGELIPAEKELRRALELNPKSAQADFNLGNVLYLTGRDAEAKTALEDGLTHSPASAMGRYFLGCVLTRMKEFGPAEDQLKSARELDPTMSQVQIALAMLFLQTGRRSDALGTFEQFLRQFPNDPLAPKVRDAVKKLSQSQNSGEPHS